MRISEHTGESAADEVPSEQQRLLRTAFRPDRRMKLLYTNFHSGSGGGHTTYIRELARGLSGRHEVHVAAPEDSRLLHEARGIPGLHAFAQTYPNGLRTLPARRRACARLHAYLEEHRFDIVHVNGSADHRLVI
ncbi:MAG TPA: glycosyltransferase family 4 protein, partial [Pseudoxanthomonas sp.]